ncbi:Sensor protein kinase WalK [Acaryochloris thomasi RCC1774]|uniref:histidine kinase n=1 Tax=Acaryochloris thomasi RCC1774 TaxID=1764569 RepID=A0A2W1JFA2_9CYAN|nr:HAMP domain-containing sensor histidine kinase [Acaryochloris thomasi]PZD72370.1 Sensor protein kinase WalK [Acaryochloris thomasi RCC1774]
MPVQFRILSELFKARLSRQIELWIFLSILVIEAILLIPSVIRREQELLYQLSAVSSARASGILSSLPQISGPELLEQLQKLQADPVVLGGTLYRADGKRIGQFGEPPELSYRKVTRNQQAKILDRFGQRYDSAWMMVPSSKKYTLIIRHDVTQVQHDIFAFVGRISLLVLIISVFVTVATMIVVYTIVITPVLQLRADLLRAGELALQDQPQTAPPFVSLDHQRHDELGDVITAFGQMYRQISDAIAQRKASEQRFRALVEQAVDAIFVINAQGRVVEVNQQACRNLGYTSTELLMLSVPDIQKQLTAADFKVLWQRLTPGIPVTIEGIHRRKDSSTFPVEVRLGLFEFSDEQFILALSRDATERKAAEKLTEQLAEIGELATMIVHEVRNPLTTVLMGLNAFKNIDLTERFQMRLTLALEEAERLQRLLNEILLYAKQQQLERTELDVNHLITDSMASIKAIPSVAERELKIELSAVPITISGDRDKLRQVFINLISNASEASPPGEMIQWHVEADPVRNRVTIRVKNGGEPIPAATIPKLTQPFYTTKSSGNGLGLAITNRIVEAHQGTLLIESSELGTTVTVSLPMQPSRPS